MSLLGSVDIFSDQVVFQLKKCDSTLVCSTSNGYISALDLNTKRWIKNINVDQIKEFELVGHSIFCCGNSEIRHYDTRTKCDTPVSVFRCKKPVISIDVHNDKIISGSEFCSGESDVCLWDIRSTDAVAKYSDLHTEDVTCVRFCKKNDFFVSASVDGLANICQISDPEPYMVLNPATSISKAVFDNEFLFLFSDSTEELSKWDLSTGSLVKKFGTIKCDPAADYLIDYYGYLFYGNNSGDFFMSTLLDNFPVQNNIKFANAHRDTVRSVLLDNNLVVAGDEQSKISFWSL